MGVLKDALGNVEMVVDRNATVREEEKRWNGISLALQFAEDAVYRLEAEVEGLAGKLGILLCQATATAPPNTAMRDEEVERATSPARAKLYNLINRMNSLKEIVADLTNRLDV